jgi:hypothetical protein
MKERERIARLVRALMAKTTEAGATEAEAMAAAGKIRELLETHQMDMSEAELTSDGYAEAEFGKGDNVKKQVFRFLASCVCKWTGTTSIRHTYAGKQTKITVFGLKSDVEFAAWLISSLTDFIMSGARAHTKDAARRRAYALMACGRIKERLQEITPKATASDSRSLVIVKEALAKAELQRRRGEIPAAKPWKISVMNSPSDISAGARRGDAAQFNRPIGRDGQLALPGKTPR